jgi:uncharacterized protein YpbB
LQLEIRQKQKTMEICLDKFTVSAYLKAKSKSAIEENELKYKKKEKEKTAKNSSPSTKEQSFILYQQGKNIEEIAKERSLTVSTIEGHLLYYVKNGDISLEELIPSEKIAKIKEILQKNSELSLSEIKSILGDDYSYGAIRFVRGG